VSLHDATCNNNKTAHPAIVPSSTTVTNKDKWTATTINRSCSKDLWRDLHLRMEAVSTEDCVSQWHHGGRGTIVEQQQQEQSTRSNRTAQRTIVDNKRKKGSNLCSDSLTNFVQLELWERKRKKSDFFGSNLVFRREQAPWIPWVDVVFRLEYPSPTVMVTFGGIHFNFLSLGKQDSTMGISARKNRSWHGREQVRHIFLTPNPTNLKTTTTHGGIQEAGLPPWIASFDDRFRIY
jgi:hypothetical protein